jgi:amino acid permease
MLWVVNVSGVRDACLRNWLAIKVGYFTIHSRTKQQKEASENFMYESWSS